MAFQATTLIAGALLLLILFVSAGYFFWLPQGGDADPAVAAPVARHWDRWRKAEPRAYRYVVRRSCDCSRDFLAAYTVTVEDGRASAAFDIPVESSDGGFVDVPPEPDTIEDIFAAIRSANANGDDVSAGYDRRRGFPVAVTIRTRSGNTGWEVRDFQVLDRATER